MLNRRSIVPCFGTAAPEACFIVGVLCLVWHGSPGGVFYHIGVLCIFWQGNPGDVFYHIGVLYLSFANHCVSVCRASSTILTNYLISAMVFIVTFLAYGRVALILSQNVPPCPEVNGNFVRD